jgi:hypothetical protein
MFFQYRGSPEKQDIYDEEEQTGDNRITSMGYR